jgi:HK97 family phage prohead protease
MTDYTRDFSADLEIRSDGTGRTIHGIVVPFDTVATVSDGGPAYRESFQRGSFAKTIAERGDRVKLLSHHDRGRNPLGRATALREDAAGLYGEFAVSRTTAGDEALELVRDGALDSFSVGFAPVKAVRTGKVTVRTEVHLREASLVTFPAYEDARIAAVRSLTPAELEELAGESVPARLAHRTEAARAGVQAAALSARRRVTKSWPAWACPWLSPACGWPSPWARPSARPSPWPSAPASARSRQAPGRTAA